MKRIFIIIVTMITLGACTKHEVKLEYEKMISAFTHCVDNGLTEKAYHMFLLPSVKNNITYNDLKTMIMLNYPSEVLRRIRVNSTISKGDIYNTKDSTQSNKIVLYKILDIVEFNNKKYMQKIVLVETEFAPYVAEFDIKPYVKKDSITAFPPSFSNIEKKGIVNFVNEVAYAKNMDQKISNSFMTKITNHLDNKQFDQAYLMFIKQFKERMSIGEFKNFLSVFTKGKIQRKKNNESYSLGISKRNLKKLTVIKSYDCYYTVFVDNKKYEQIIGIADSGNGLEVVRIKYREAD